MAIDNLEHARDVKYIITETINKIYKKGWTNRIKGNTYVLRRVEYKQQMQIKCSTMKVDSNIL